MSKNKTKINNLKESEKYQKENPFKVPENYFADFPGKIRSKINMDASKGVTRSKLMILKPYISIAASFLILFGFWYLFLSKGISYKNLSNDNTETALTEMDYFIEELKQEELFEIFTNIDTFDIYNTAYNEEEMAEILYDIDDSIIIEAL